MTRIGVFYDGNYFLHVSNYYNYDHPRQRRLSITGLHNFIKQEVATLEGNPPGLCQIVDAHYFRGRLSAQEAHQRGAVLYWDRVFDDILMSAGVTTHYLPLRSSNGRKEEKGIDVWLALEAYENAVHKHFDVLVLIASDGDFLPLVRKLNTLGTRVMILSWDFEFTNDMGKTMITRTSQDLLEEVSYPVPMHEIIDNRLRRNDPIITSLFVPGESKRRTHPVFSEGSDDAINVSGMAAPDQTAIGESHVSEILSLKNGYGFIKFPPNNLFFHYTSVKDLDFNDLLVGDKVEFILERNDDNQLIATNVQLLEANPEIDEEIYMNAPVGNTTAENEDE
ncbi:MAG: NYN domain-containing protein [Saprospiraceae bacterium]